MTTGTARAVARRAPSPYFTAADVAATGLFGFEGAVAAVAAGLDLLGIVVVGFATALFGGVIRDVLLGDAPPAAFRSPLRIIVAVAGALLAVPFGSLAADAPGVIGVLDAIALALFVAAGAQKALEWGSNGFVVVALGTITGVGGGVIRDLLLSHSPTVLTTGFYATAAIIGAAAQWATAARGIRTPWPMAVGFAVCVTLRTLALAYDWRLPVFG
ncbi:TRIC cation channel family protein [Agromyces sp. PvR057]|uniref:trimeric intracellular cation channel family protein n=1 Tax=Agromyces sp. PvR057 TaxID=3156403 RepID=UPI003394BF68